MTQPAAAQSKLPADVSTWKKGEYYQARRDGDPKLKDAVKYLGKTFSLKQTKDAKRSDQAATLLVRLLSGELPKSVTESPAAQSAAGSGSSDASASNSADPPMGPPEGMMGPPGGAMGPPEAMSGPPEGMYGPGMPGMPGGNGGMGDAGQIKPLDVDTMKLIVYALAVNGGKVAKKALGEILAGTLKSDSDPVATRSALETLVKYPGPESEDTLLKAIISPDSIRPKPKTDSKQAGAGPMAIPGAAMPPGSSVPESSPEALPGGPPEGMAGMSANYPAPGGYPGMESMGYPGGMMGGAQGKVGAAELQTLALAVAAPSAAEEFRVKVAIALSGGSTAAEFRGPLIKFLMAPNPENLAAQFILLKGTTIDAVAKATIGSYLTTYSSQALCAMLGIPTQSLNAHRAAAAGGTRGMGMPSGYPASGAPGSDASTMEAPPGMVPPEGMAPPAGMVPPPGMAPPAGDPMSGPPGPGPGMSYPGMPGGAYPGMEGSFGGGAGAATALSVIELAKQYAEDPELAFRVGRQLWGGDFVAMVASRLDSVPSLRNGAAEVLLASTVPTDAVRARLFELLKENWDEGPKALEAAGLGGAVISDPGFLAVIKALPRKDQEPEKLTALQRYRRERLGGGAQGAGPGGMPMQPTQDLKKAKGAQKKAKGGRAKAQPDAEGVPGGPPMSGAPMPGMEGPGQTMGGQQAGQSPEFQWMDASELLVRAMCEQFGAAAKAVARKGGTVSEESRPLDIPASANVVAEYHFDWPKSLASSGGLSGVSPDPMTVHYIRMEQKTSPRKVFAYFRNRIIRPAEHPVPTGFWMESFRPVPGTDRQRSVDILVTKKEDPTKERARVAGGAVAGMPLGMPGPGGPPGMSGPEGPAGMQPGMAGMEPGMGGMQPGQRERADKDEVGEQVVEILTVEVKSPAPIPDRSTGEEEEAASGKETTPAKGKSKTTTIE